MADVSNPTERVLEVLNFLGAHPTEAFTLAEIARNTGLSKATGHRILATMTEARFLSRNEKHKTYSLGLALVALGRATLEKHRGIDFARREIARLAQELNVQCSVTAATDDELLLLAKEGVPQSSDGLHQVGERAPILPTIAIGHIAWQSDQAIQAYLARPSARMPDALRRHCLAAVPRIRQRGYSIAANGPARIRLRQALHAPIGRIRDAEFWASLYEATLDISEKEMQILDVVEMDGENIAYISAPVFSPDGSVSIELVITGMPNGLRAHEIERYAERLRAAAAIVTGEVHGRYPDFDPPA